MNIINASAEIITPFVGEEVMKHIEICGRVCYKSESRITEDSCNTFIRGIIKRGHESVLEHFSFTARFICDRGVSHEIVRHRLASYSQESTRYCNYSAVTEDFNGEITVIKPLWIDEENYRSGFANWRNACEKAEREYFRLITDCDWTPQQARSVLPNSLKTEVVMTANLREWRHFFKLRCAPAAHPQMREVATQLFKQAYAKLPVIFEDIAKEMNVEC